MHILCVYLFLFLTFLLVVPFCLCSHPSAYTRILSASFAFCFILRCVLSLFHTDYYWQSPIARLGVLALSTYGPRCDSPSIRLLPPFCPLPIYYLHSCAANTIPCITYSHLVKPYFCHLSFILLSFFPIPPPSVFRTSPYSFAQTHTKLTHITPSFEQVRWMTRSYSDWRVATRTGNECMHFVPWTHTFFVLRVILSLPSDMPASLGSRYYPFHLLIGTRSTFCLNYWSLFCPPIGIITLTVGHHCLVSSIHMIFFNCCLLN